MIEEHLYQNSGIVLNYYEIKNNLTPIVLLHAQGVDAGSFEPVYTKLSKRFHIYSVDCYGHGKSLHDAAKYNVVDIGNAVIDFIKNEIKENVCLLGHSSGGLIAAYVASHSDVCEYLILEDPPFFSSQGERRKDTFNYVDLSTVCNEFLKQTEETDFVLYYFNHQYAWNFFPEESREKIRKKMTDLAAKSRQRHPDRDLKVPFWPKAALSAFKGMNCYDPRFGEAFYDDSFHRGIPHEELLRNIRCKTLFMKAKTNVSPEGILMAALSEEDVQRTAKLVTDCTVVRFDCGHGIHIEKRNEFIDCILSLLIV